MNDKVCDSLLSFRLPVIALLTAIAWHSIGSLFDSVPAAVISLTAPVDAAILKAAVHAS